MKKRNTILMGAAALLCCLGLSLTLQPQRPAPVSTGAAALQSPAVGNSQPLPARKGPAAAPLPEEAAGLSEIDLEALSAVNEDVSGWIAIPGTDLSYPLVQGSDNDYYLNHTWQKEPSSGGAVFLEYTSDRNLTDFHTLVYAHRLTMFSPLKYYRDQDFWEAHPSIYVVTGQGVSRYDIFSVEEASVTGLVFRLDLEENELEEAFLRDCVDNSVVETGIVPETDARILTLSTCTGHGHDTRWVVHGVLAQVYAADTEAVLREIAGAAVGFFFPLCAASLG